MVMSIVIAAAFLVVVALVVRGVVVKSSKLGTSAQPRFNMQQRLRRMMIGLAVMGCFCLIGAFGNRPTPYNDLIPAAGRVTDIVTVSERSSSNSNSAPSSINPFTPHDWIELTVEPTEPKSLKDTVTWRVNTIADKDALRRMYGTNITARINSLGATSKAYEVKTSTGETFTSYDEIATFERRGMILYLCGAAFFFLLAGVMSVRAKNTPADAV